ncbi:hypothetical protein MN116_006021 [Schistosoma mekongi]|uniref:Protein DGCR14 n=1 Tax=Schistosoma mekongi TaxID=38744 RepID=A0AAE2D435_SCHME|nr:hypothetical protein MN116_006021 [Schistosoma mekongi]
MDRVSSKVVHDADGQKKLVSYNPIQGRITTQTIRGEEEYIEHLGQIIQRDFFPSLSPNEEKSIDDESREGGDCNLLSTDSHNPEKSDPTAMSLDKYMANNTTEDDASFAELVEENEKKQRIKLAPFFPSLQCSAPAPLDNPKTLALPGVSNAVVGPRVTITGNNAVHFNPDGVSQTKEELLEFLSKERKIVSSNTRFKRPFPVNLEKKRTMKHLLATKLGRFGLNGLEMNTPYGTPQASGYKFIDSSPSPMTMFPHTPLMTWGELDSTPYRLDNSEMTPSVVSGSPAFRIPSPSQREQLAHQLADKASRQRVRDRLEAVKRMKSAASSPSRSLLSPAALRLLASSSSIINNESNSRPSTGTGRIGGQTSSPLPKVNTPRRVPSDLGVVRRTNSARSTPHRESVKADVDQKKVSLERGGNLDGKTESSSSITDNLLNLKFQNL